MPLTAPSNPPHPNPPHSQIMAYIESGKAEGATLLTGGRRPPRLQTGFYIEPTGGI